MIEDANVELTNELVQMIVQRRGNYQANAQSIKAQDQVQTLSEPALILKPPDTRPAMDRLITPR